MQAGGGDKTPYSFGGERRSAERQETLPLAVGSKIEKKFCMQPTEPQVKCFFYF